MSESASSRQSCCCSPAENTTAGTRQEDSSSACCTPQAEPKAKDETSSCCSPKASVACETTAAEESGEPCCPPSPQGSCCTPDPAQQRRSWERPGHRLWHFVCGLQQTAVGEVPQVTTNLTAVDIFGSWQMRWGIGRDRYRIAPGLYAIGTPDASAEVLVSANYKLSFDHLRKELAGRNLWLLVLETYGVNVWCAAGKGTFGTEEIIRRVKASELDRVVDHRRLILPQLGAPGVAAHEVRKGCGFSVSYGPVRASDLPAFLDAGRKASAQMRRVTFSARERLILTPVELTGLGRQTLYALLAVLVIGGIGPSVFSFSGLYQRGGSALLVFLCGLLAGAVVTPLLLPRLPWRAFAAKGALVGTGTALLCLLLWGKSMGAANGFALLLAMPAVASWYAMNFTGSSTYTSPSGVEKEMRRAIPCQIGALVAAAASWVYAAF